MSQDDYKNSTRKKRQTLYLMKRSSSITTLLRTSQKYTAALALAFLVGVVTLRHRGATQFQKD